MDNDAENCTVCFMAYDCTSRRPRNLPCGHCFCTPCMDGIKQQGVATCPTCRVRHTVPEEGRFPVSYGVEAFLKRVKSLDLTSATFKSVKEAADPTPSPTAGPVIKGLEGLSRVVCSLLQEHDGKIMAAIITSRELKTQLDQYQTTLADWDGKQQHLEDKLQALIDQSKNARELLQQEMSKVLEKKQQVDEGEQQLQALLQAIRTAATREEAYAVIDDADHSLEEERQRGEECVAMFPDVHTVTTITKAMEVTCAALEAAASVQAGQEVGAAALEAAASIQVGQEEVGAAAAAAAGDSSLPATVASSSFSISDKVAALVLPTLKAENLRSLTQPVRYLLREGLVFAVHKTEEEQSRHARISLEDGRLYLHHLQDQPLPRYAYTLQMEEVVAAEPPFMVFLQLAWPGKAPRCVFIRVSTNTALGRQFLMLCTGQRGPCYAGTKLFGMDRKGEPGEGVYGGDYEHGDGTGGAALLPDLGKGEYRDSCMMGDVGGGSSTYDPAKGAVFFIVIKDRLRSRLYGNFGQVVEGLKVVQEAAQHDPITEVTVVDCGAVLWQ